MAFSLCKKANMLYLAYKYLSSRLSMRDSELAKIESMIQKKAPIKEPFLC
jgi:hypothetical protein